VTGNESGGAELAVLISPVFTGPPLSTVAKAQKQNFSKPRFHVL